MKLKTWKRVGLTLLLSATTMGSSGPVPGPPSNCALRNPQRQIYEVFPEATNFRTVSGNVDPSVMQTIASRFDLEVDFSDLGKTSMCIVLRDGVPIGFVHARAEVGRRGTVEIVWALDVELRVRDLRIQRSREKHTADIEAEAFRKRLQGANWIQLQEFLEHFAADGDALGLPERSSKLGRLVLRSGLKTAAILGSGYLDTVLNAQLLGATHREFPDTTQAKLSHAKVHDPSTDNTTTMSIVRAEDQDGRIVGHFVQARWSAHEKRPTLWLSIDAEGRLGEVRVFDLLDQETSDIFSDVRGKKLAELGDLPVAPRRFLETVLGVVL